MIVHCKLYNVQCSTLYTKVYAGKEAFYGLFLKVTEIGRFFSTTVHQQTKNKVNHVCALCSTLYSVLIKMFLVVPFVRQGGCEPQP